MCIRQYCLAGNFYRLLNQMNSVNSTTFLCLDLGGSWRGSVCWNHVLFGI